MASKFQPGVGQETLQLLGADQLALGMASSDYASDGGFGPSSFGVNPKVLPGAVYSTASEVDASTSVAGNLIASCEDSQATGAAVRLFVDDAANYYSWNGSAVTKQKTGTATTHYVTAKTDMASFNGYTFATLDNDVAQWNTSSNVLAESWWVTTKGQAALDATVPHPLVVFENYLWIGSGSALYNVDASLACSSSNWALNSSERIYAMGIDPSTGLMMVSVQTAVNISDTLTSRFFVYLYDGYSTKPRRKIEVDDLVTSFRNVGGTVFVGMGTSLGYWNGNGVSFLRKLASAGYAFADLPYKHHMAVIGTTLYVVDGAEVLAFGEIVAGAKAKYYVYRQGGGAHLSMVCSAGSGKLGVAYATNKFATVDLAATGAGTGMIASQLVAFPRPVYVRKVRVLTTGVAATSAFGIGSFQLVDETTASRAPSVASFVNQTGATKHVFDFQFAGLRLNSAQLRISFDTQGFGIIRAIAYYDVAYD